MRVLNAIAIHLAAVFFVVIDIAGFVLPIASVAAANAIHRVVAATRSLVSDAVSIVLNDAVVAVDLG